jgi:cell division protein FtsQ
MNGALKLFAWTIALTLVALPIVGVLNGWFAADRWPVTRLSVQAEFDHVSADQIRAAAQPHLGQGFFAIHLGPMRDAIAKLPWVERVEARKRWPDTVDLVVYEQQPYARWGADRLVNRHGKLFAAAGAADLQGLPRLSGPDDRIDDVLRFYADCQREFSGSGLVVNAIAVSPRDGWRIGLASGTVIELGREQRDERLRRFLDVWPRLATSHTQPPTTIDLRYANGFAASWPAEPAPAATSGGKPATPSPGDRVDAAATRLNAFALLPIHDLRFPTS